MEAPYSIASLPKPLDTEGGRLWASAVHGLKGVKKRKRHEVAVAVDGESVNIYNVQSQSLVTSYALPPHAYLCCRPCSIYCRATNTTPTQRRTYAVVKDGPDSPKRSLVCFTETINGGKVSSPEALPPAKRECAVPDGEVCAIDVASLGSQALPDVVLSYKNGRIVLVDGDLTKTKEVRPTLGESAGVDEVEHSTIVDAESARKGLLKGREDVLALLDQNETGAPTIICQILRSGSTRKLDMSTLRTGSQHALQISKPGVQPLTHHTLPTSNKISSGPANYDLHAGSATLYQLAHGTLSVFDLSGTIPKTVSEFGSDSRPITKFARLSSTTVIAVSENVVMVYETTYGSVQASVTLDNEETAKSKPSKKRKRDGEKRAKHSTPASTAVFAFADLGLVVLSSDQQILASQLSDDVRRRTRSKVRAARLADVIGQGGTGYGSKEDKRADKWAKWTAQVDELVQTNNFEGLEMFVANDAKLGRQRNQEKSHRKSLEDDESMDGDAAAYDDLWPLPEPLDPTQLDRKRIMYVVRQILGYKTDGSGIEIKIQSRKLLEWFTLTGCHDLVSVQDAVETNDGVQRDPVRSGDVMTAISDVEDGFQLMHSLLSLPTNWELAEVVQALALLIRSFDVPADLDQLPLALPAPPETNGDVAMLNGDSPVLQNGDTESHLDLESQAAENELENVMRVLKYGLEVRSNTLRAILERLHAFPSRDVTQTMRSMLTHKELIFFIHVLRIELAGGGWTSRYVDAGAEEEDEGPNVPSSGMVDVITSDEPSGPSDYAILAISDLLNSAVDAIGTSGWLVGLSGDTAGTEDLLDSLRAEVSAGLEGCYEAHTLETSLAELGRCALGMGEGVGREDEVLLPVGGRGARGGKADAKKSRLVLAMEKSKRVGKYSFDRVRI